MQSCIYGTEFTYIETKSTLVAFYNSENANYYSSCSEHVLEPSKIHSYLQFYMARRTEKKLTLYLNIWVYKLQPASQKQNKRAHNYFLASNFFGSISKGVVLSRKSLAARSCRVPPHFNPRT